MVTVIYSLDKVNGAEVMLFGWLVCAIVYIFCCLLCRENRSREGIRDMLRYLLAAEIVADIIWAILYYEDGRYVNYGVGSVYGVLIWPVILLTAGVLLTIRNKDREDRHIKKAI